MWRSEGTTMHSYPGLFISSVQCVTTTRSTSFLLSEVGDLSILEVKLVHEGLAVKQVIKGLISNLKQTRS